MAFPKSQARRRSPSSIKSSRATNAMASTSQGHEIGAAANKVVRDVHAHTMHTYSHQVHVSARCQSGEIKSSRAMTPEPSRHPTNANAVAAE
jgi:hypothetical protein